MQRAVVSQVTRDQASDISGSALRLRSRQTVGVWTSEVGNHPSSALAVRNPAGSSRGLVGVDAPEGLVPDFGRPHPARGLRRRAARFDCRRPFVKRWPTARMIRPCLHSPARAKSTAGPSPFEPAGRPKQPPDFRARWLAFRSRGSHGPSGQGGPVGGQLGANAGCARQKRPSGRNRTLSV